MFDAILEAIVGIFSGRSADLEATREAIERQSQALRRVKEEIDDLEREVDQRFANWEARLQGAEARQRLMAEEMEERIERGNKAWRRVRASQPYAEQHGDGEEEPEPDSDLPAGNGEGRPEQRVRSMYGDLAPPGASPQPYQQVARLIAQRIAGKA